MPRLSAGVVLYRMSEKEVEVFLVHPGGPFWATKDEHAWSIPKGEYDEGEDAWQAAQREFSEETGFDLPKGELVQLGSVRYSNKQVVAWALQGNAQASQIKSNFFSMEWPPKTGQIKQFEEVDRAGWFTVSEARQKLVKGQAKFIDRLCEQIDASGKNR